MIRLQVGVNWGSGRAGRGVTLAVAGGGTAGHVVPGLAVLEEWRRLAPEADFLFLGGEGGFEERFTSMAGVELVRLPSSPFARQGRRGKARAAFNAVRATAAALRLFRTRRPALALGFGGYASAPALAAASLAGIPSALHEANLRPGLGNRLSARWVDKVFLGWRETDERLDNPHCQFVGNPLPRSRLPPGGRTMNGSGLPRVLVLGGSEGSPELNERAPALLGAVQRLLSRPLRVLHVCGWGEKAAVESLYRAESVEARVDCFVEKVEDLYGECDFAVATAGSFTLAELAAWRIPALLAPLEGAAGRHQHANAEAFAARSDALLHWEPALVADLLHAPEKLQRAADRMGRAFDQGAAETLARACLEMIR